MSGTQKTPTILAWEFREEVPPIETWHKWLELAAAATTLEEKVGLLHVGFEVRMDWAPLGFDYTDADRLEFYFGVAEGWRSFLDLRNPGILAGNDPEYQHVGWDKNGYSVKRTQSRQRQVLAMKAFKMLAVEFFKEWMSVADEQAKYGHDIGGYYESLLIDPVFPVIQSFFRREDRRNGEGICNLPWSRYSEPHRTPQEKIVIEFLCRLPEVIWTWKEDETMSYDRPEEVARKNVANEKTRAIVANAKLWMIEVLSALRQLDLLEKWLLDLDEPCLAKLKEIALRTRNSSAPRHLGLEPDPLVTTLEEACYEGSAAALLLLRYEVVKREYERRMQVRKAQAMLDEAQRRLAAANSRT